MKKTIFISLGVIIILVGCYITINRNNLNLNQNNNINEGDKIVNEVNDIDTDKNINLGKNNENNNGNMGLANPASTNCIEKGGELEIKERKDGGQYGVCYFEDNRQCEEWALFNGRCPEGGVKVTGYDTDEQIFCAIMGGEVLMEEGICKYGEGEYDLNLFMNGEK